jgi:SSS family transporter
MQSCPAGRQFSAQPDGLAVKRFLETFEIAMNRAINVCCLPLGLLLLLTAASLAQDSGGQLEWDSLPELPDSLGLGGPLVGVHNDALIVGGGANFPEPVWENDKVWRKAAWVLTRGDGGEYAWQGGFTLDRPIAYAACASTKQGVVCIGGNNDKLEFADCFLLQWNLETAQLGQLPLPSLPEPCAYGAAAVIGETVYLTGGQTGSDLATATSRFLRLDMSEYDGTAGSVEWERLPDWPGPARAFHIAVAQHNGFDDCVYVISGRCANDAEGVDQAPGETVTEDWYALRDVFEFNPRHYDGAAFDAAGGAYSGAGRFASPWRRRADIPQCVMAGPAAPIGQSHIFVLGGDTGRLAGQTDQLKLDHPGFPKKTFAYHTITDTWIEAGELPANQVTTPAVRWGKAVIVASGEIKPRVRTPQVWAVTAVESKPEFGAVNFSVLVVYLAAMVGVGVYFARKNKNTDDYFRGGQKIAWWAAGCSIFATMLSSITYMAIPAKAFAQDIVYLLGNLMIPVVAIFIVLLALPFYRRIDATSAYEYLEKRFNRVARLIASSLFTVFHTFRMGIVMSLAALALATVTPLTPAQCVLIMGVLSILYCTMGGVEAVVWTDTLQTFVLLGGAVLCLALTLVGSGEGIGGFFSTALADGKLHFVNLHGDPTSASLALWVVVIGAIGQNFSTYTSDQAVVQRYMTTPDIHRAANSIWLAALLSIPASVMFFALGTTLYVFYKANPEKLDPTYLTDQILPLFIANEVPIGIAGLIVAGIFAAAQSTISTSMNSTATAVVSDFLRPVNALKSERSYLNTARAVTFTFGVLGTLLGLMFIDPNNRSLFDSFLKVIGLFMGVLGGLFALGMLTRRATGLGSLAGALAGATVMCLLPIYSQINGYLYAAIGITTCFVVGLIASVLLPSREKSLDGLTIYTTGDDSSVGRNGPVPDSE